MTSLVASKTKREIVMNDRAHESRRDKSKVPPPLPPKVVTGRKRPLAQSSNQSNHWIGIAIGAGGMLIVCLIVGIIYLVVRTSSNSSPAVVTQGVDSDQPEESLAAGTQQASEDRARLPTAQGDQPDLVGQFLKHLAGPSSTSTSPPQTSRSVGVETVVPTPASLPEPDSGKVETVDVAAENVVSNHPESVEEFVQATGYVELPAFPAGPTAAKDEVLLRDLGASRDFQFRLLGLTEFTSDLTWEVAKEDPQRINVLCSSRESASGQELLGRFRVQEGRLHFKWTHQTGRFRALQEFLREAVLEIRQGDGATSRFIALRKPTVGKAEGIERLLKDDRKIMVGKALSGVGKRPIFLSNVTLNAGGRNYDSVPLRFPTRENRDSVSKKEQERKRPTQARPSNRITKDDATDNDDDGLDDDDLDDEPAGTTELEANRFRQQNFPAAAAQVKLPKLFVEIFPHADHVVLRLDTDPSYVAHFRRLMAAKARIASLNKGIRFQQNLAAKARTNADNFAAAARNANNQGERGNAMANSQRALQDAQRAENQIVQLRAQFPKWEQMGTEAESQCAKIKSALAQISGATVSGTMYRMVEGVRVDVVQMGSQDAENGKDEQAEPDSGDRS